MFLLHSFPISLRFLPWHLQQDAQGGLQRRCFKVSVCQRGMLHGQPDQLREGWGSFIPALTNQSFFTYLWLKKKEAHVGNEPEQLAPSKRSCETPTMLCSICWTLAKAGRWWRRKPLVLPSCSRRKQTVHTAAARGCHHLQTTSPPGCSACLVALRGALIADCCSSYWLETFRLGPSRSSCKPSVLKPQRVCVLPGSAVKRAARGKMAEDHCCTLVVM